MNSVTTSENRSPGVADKKAGVSLWYDEILAQSGAKERVDFFIRRVRNALKDCNFKGVTVGEYHLDGQPLISLAGRIELSQERAFLSLMDGFGAGDLLKFGRRFVEQSQSAIEIFPPEGALVVERRPTAR